MSEKKKEIKNFKMCKKCSLDCERVRMLSLAKFSSESQKKEQELKQYGNNTPKYKKETCPKV